MITTRHQEFVPREVSLSANPTLGSLAAQSVLFFDSMTPSTTPTTANENRIRNRNRSVRRGKSRSTTKDNGIARRKQRRDASCQSDRTSVSILHDVRSDATPTVHHPGGEFSPWSISRSPKNRTTTKAWKTQTNKNSKKPETEPKPKSKRAYKSFSESAKIPPTSHITILSKASKASDSNPPRNSEFRANLTPEGDPAGRSGLCSRWESLGTSWENNVKGPSKLSDEENCTSSWKSSYRSRRSRRRRRRAKARIHQSPRGNQHRTTASDDGTNAPKAATHLRNAESTTATSILLGIIAGGSPKGGLGNEKPKATEQNLYDGTPTGPFASSSASSHCSIYNQCYCEKCFDVALHWQIQEGVACYGRNSTGIRNRSRHRNWKPQETSLVRDLFRGDGKTPQCLTLEKRRVDNPLPLAPGVPLYCVNESLCKRQGESPLSLRPRPQVAEAEFGLSPSSTACVFSNPEPIFRGRPQLLGASPPCKASSTTPDRAGKAWMEDDNHTASSVPSVVGPFVTCTTDWLELSYSSDEDWGEEDWEDEAGVDDKQGDDGLVKSWSKDWLKLSSGHDIETTNR